MATVGRDPGDASIPSDSAGSAAKIEKMPGSNFKNRFGVCF